MSTENEKLEPLSFNRTEAAIILIGLRYALCGQKMVIHPTLQHKEFDVWFERSLLVARTLVPQEIIITGELDRAEVARMVEDLGESALDKIICFEMHTNPCKGENLERMQRLLMKIREALPDSTIKGLID